MTTEPRTNAYQATGQAGESSSPHCPCDEHDVGKSTRLTTEIVDGVTVRLPVERPPLTQAASRVLLAILIELTEVPVLDVADERGTE